MILIADSGSTKSAWSILDEEGKVQEARTSGYNPHHQTAEQIRDLVRKELFPQLPAGFKPSHIYYYGAGCSSAKSKSIINTALSEAFPTAEVVVEHDLLAAARALCGDEAGIACILGTGSNSCLYDGQNITHNISALGWIMGDEGSGSDLGKRVVADYLRFDMPEHLRAPFEQQFGVLNAEEVLDRIYRQPFPKPYIAAHARFLHNNLQDPWCYGHVYDSLRSFVLRNVVKYPNYQQHKLHFVGSIAYHYKDVLLQVLEDMGLAADRILENPVAGLIEYHQK